MRVHDRVIVQNNPVNYIDPTGLSPDLGINRAKRYLSEANGDANKAWSRAYDEREARKWEAITPEGKVLREAENYLWAYKVVSEGECHWYGRVGSYAANSLLSIPLWQALRTVQNLAGYELQSPASMDALMAGHIGADDGLSAPHRRRR